MSFKIEGKPQSADIFKMSGDNVCNNLFKMNLLQNKNKIIYK